MRSTLFASVSAMVLVGMPGVVSAQSTTGSDDSSQVEEIEELSPASRRTRNDQVIIVTATRREQDLQDVPLSVTAFSQEDLTEQGIVGYEGLAQQTPGVVINRPSANFNNFTVRGISTNGYGAGLNPTVAIYIDELPISANGNSTVLDPSLFDVERVEFLRGPQGTLFGSSSLAGAMRIITHNPDLDDFEVEGLIDLGLQGDDSFRQRYNAMVNVPLVQDRLAFRAVGFYRHEEGYIDNVGTGIDNANTLDSIGGRAMLRWEPTDRLSAQFTVLYEDSDPEDSSTVNPNLGTYVRRSDRPDLFQANLRSYNATIEYDFDGADLISSSTFAEFDQLFVVDLAGTFNQAIAFALDAYAYDDIFVQETRLASDPGGSFDWVIGGFYYDKRRDTDLFYRSTPEFLAARNLTGLTDEYYQRLFTHTNQSELAGFGELTYRFGDSFWLTGGLRYTHTEVQSFQEAAGYNSNYLTAALFGLTNFQLTVTPYGAVEGLKVSDDNLSWKASASWQPVPEITTYASVSTGFRAPVVNARAGLVSTLDPTDIVIPAGADSDSLINYEVGLKGRFFDGDLIANIAAYYIDWNDIQVQANRVSDSIQFATNIGGAVSKGIEFEIIGRIVPGVTLSINAAFNDTEVNELSLAEAAISGAELGIQLAGPEFQGSATLRYDFDLSPNATGWVSGNIRYVGDFPGLFPNVPGQPGVPSPQFAFTEDYAIVNLVAGAEFGRFNLAVYVENVFSENAITYVHPEAFIDSRFGRVPPRTVGVRAGFSF